MYKQIFLLSVILCISYFSSFSQITTGGIKGTVINQSLQKLSNATIIARHLQTGEKYSTTSQNNGDYILPNMKSGGPYEIICSYVGYINDTTENIILSLGNFSTIDFDLKNAGVQLKEVIINGGRSGLFNKKRNGAATNISKEQLAQLPTLSRSLQDFTRLSPQANGNSFAGSNYRYNNLSVDGASLNDAFGFTESTSGAGGSQATGTPGSLARTQPISLESVQEVQVSVSPFNVTAGNFTGGSINAVTRSGTNITQGSIFFSGRNQILTGLSATKERKKIDNFYDYQTGFRLGGAIKKNSLFYFTSVEIGRREEPVSFAPGSAESAIPLDVAKAIADTLTKRYNYNSGSYGDIKNLTSSNKIFARIDWNISEKHKLQIRNNLVSGFSDYLERGANSLNFESQGYRHLSTTNSTVLELKSNFSNKLSNNLILGYTTVNDRRDIRGEFFPHIEITYNTANTIFAGAYREAAIYGLTLKTKELTDNLVFYRNKHTITLGTHNEFYNINYRFLTAYNGRWAYSSPANFFAEKPSRIRGVYNVNNNDYNFNKENSSARFNIFLLGTYLQDEFAISKRLNITGGIRFDFTVQPDAEQPNPKVTSIKEFSAYQNKVSNSPQVAPRIGFNLNLLKENNLQIRGGVGIFNGRIPFNWLAYPYYNDGIKYGNVDFRPGGAIVPLEKDLSKIAKQYQPGLTEINLLDNNFKLPQVLRSSLGIDYKTRDNWTFTLEGIYTKTLRDVLYKTINLKDSTSTLSGSQDNRTIFLGNSAQQKISTGFTNVFLLTNTNQGYRYQLSATVAKTNRNNFNYSASYTYGVSKDIANGVRNSPQANWEFNQTILPNDPKLTYSNSDLRHRIIAYLQKQFDWKAGKSSLAFVYTMQAGSPFTYVYIGDLNRDGSPNNDLIYVPKSLEDANLVDIKDASGNVSVTAAQQYSQLSSFINNDRYLKTRIGKYAERNGARTPWNNELDMKVSHTFFLKKMNNKQIQVALDVFNLSNIISRNWGRQYFVPNLLNGNYQLLSLQSISPNNKPNYIFNNPTTTPWQVDPIQSRGQGQLTVRYTF